VACWAELEEAAPELAARGRDLIETFHFLLAGTIRRDGTPRISPVEAHIVEGHLMHAIIPGTLKARDLLRDPRVVLNAPVTNAGDPGAELKLRGRALEVEDDALRAATADTIEAVSGWRPQDDWHFLPTDVEDAAYIAWRAGVMDMTRWTPERGVEHVRREVAVL